MNVPTGRRIHEAGRRISEWSGALTDLVLEAAREGDARRRATLFAAIGGLGHAIDLEAQLHVVSETAR